jgi:hypothetical protein
MTDLYHLFEAATDDLAPLPDLAPNARRIARRRSVTTALTSTVLSAALVIGVGTVVFLGTRNGPATVGAGFGSGSGGSKAITFTAKPEPGQFPNQATAALQAIWPFNGERITYTGAQKNKSFDVVTQLGTYPLTLGYESVPDSNPAEESAPCDTSSAQAGSDLFACGRLPGGQTVKVSRHDGAADISFTLDKVVVDLVFSGPPAMQVTANQMLAMGTSAAFQQLFADAVADRVMVPMPTIDVSTVLH